MMRWAYGANAPLVMRVKHAGLVIAFIVFSGCADAPLPTAPSSEPAADLLGTSGGPILNRYVNLFRDDIGDPDALAGSLVAAHGGRIGHVYEFALKGFSVANLPAPAVEALRRNHLVRSVSVDQQLRLAAVQTLPLTGTSYQTSILWALDRVDERAAVFDGRYEYAHCGAGTHIYIVDTGIHGGHVEWGYGRIGESVSKISFSWGASPTIDQNGHGTGVAGAAAGATYGIAKCATLHSVRVGTGTGSWWNSPCNGMCESDVIAGIDWVAGHHVKPAVMNVSIEGSCPIRNALEGAVTRGVITMKSAGNDGVPASEDCGNRAKGAFVVGAMDRFHRRSIFSSGGSNYGSTVALFAPGSDIWSADKDSDTDAKPWWGTSFAAPYTAGVAALFLEQEPTAPTWRINDLLKRSATSGALVSSTLPTGSPNRLLFSRAVAAEYPPPPTYPMAPEITGPDFVRPHSASCLYTTTTGSAAQPFTYAWYMDGVLQSETSQFFRPSVGTTSFQIEVHILDGDGSSWWNYYYVSVGSGAPECGGEMET